MEFSETENGLFAILKSGEIFQLEKELFSYFEYYQKWKLFSRTKKLAHWVETNCPFFNQHHYFLAKMFFDCSDFQKSCEQLSKLTNVAKRSGQQKNVQDSRNELNFQILVNELYSLGIWEDYHAFKSIKGHSAKIELIEALILFSDKIAVLEDVWGVCKKENLNINRVLAHLSMETQNRRLVNWLKGKGYDSGKDFSQTETQVGEDLDYLLIEKMIKNLSSSIDESSIGKEAVEDDIAIEPKQNARSVDIDPDSFQMLFSDAAISKNKIDLYLRNWDYQLASELNYEGDYFLAMMVLEFLKTTTPLNLLELKQTLELELSCAEKLHMENRAIRLRREILNLR